MVKPLLVTLIFGSAQVLAAQVPDMPPAAALPESVTTAFLVHLKARDWSGAAEFYDPAETTRLQQVVTRLVALPGGSEFTQSLGISDAEFPMLSGPALLGKFLALAARSEPEAFDAALAGTYTIVGRVAEDPAQVHLVVRSRFTIQSIPFTTVELKSLRQTVIGWRLQMPAELQGVIVGLEAGLAQGQQRSD